MSNVTTFGAFTMARLGIYTSTRHMDVVGNNIANINTEGYTRQKVNQSSLYLSGADRYVSKYDQRIGQGAFTTNLDQYRDPYLDIRYRNESSNVGSSDQKMYYLEQLSSILDEVAMGEDGEGVLEAQFNDMISQMEHLVTDGAGSDEADTLVRESAKALCEKFNKKANDLQELYEKELVNFKKTTLPEVNRILKDIQELNSNIRSTEIYGGNPLELKDRRNLLLDELSRYMKIDVSYDKEELGDGTKVNRLCVSTANEPKKPLIYGEYVTQFSIRPDYVQKTDANGNPMVNDAGLPIYETEPRQMTDADGKPMVDANGNPVYEQAVDEDGNPMVDAEGNPVYAPALDENGNPIYKLASDEDNPMLFLDTAPLTDLKGKEARIVTNTAKVDEAVGGPYNKRIEAFAALADALEKGTLTARAEDNGTDEATNMTYTATFNIVEVDGKYQIYYAKTTSGGAWLNDTELHGSLQSDREMLTEQGEYAMKSDQAIDANAAIKRGIPYYRKALDTLAAKFAAVMNEANAAPADEVYKMEGGHFVDSEGKPIQYTLSDGSKADVEWIDDPKLVPDVVPYEGPYVQDGTDEDGAPVYRLVDMNDEVKLSGKPVLNEGYEDYNGGIIFSSDCNGNDPNGVTAANISISDNWAHGRTRLLQSTEPNPGSTDNDNLKHILVLMTGNDHEFECGSDRTKADPFFTGSFQKMLTENMSGTLAMDNKTTGDLLLNYATLQDDLYVDRESVSGVDLNDEAMNMMQYQKSYSAACRLMTTVDEMLDKLINGMAV